MPLVWLTDFGGAMTRSVSDLVDMLNVVTATDPGDPATARASDRIPGDWRSVLDIHALEGKRIGFIPSTWVDPLSMVKTISAEKSARRYLTEAGATIVEIGVTVGGVDAPPQTPDTTTGNVRSEGWMQYIDRHPELAAEGFKITSVVDVDCSQKKIAYVRADAASCSATPPPRMTPAEIKAKRDYRVSRQAVVKMWMDTAGADHLGVDAIVYPGLLSEISINDGGGRGRASAGAIPLAQPTEFQPLFCLPDSTITIGLSAFNFSAAPGMTPNSWVWLMRSNSGQRCRAWSCRSSYSAALELSQRGHALSVTAQTQKV